MTKMFEVKATPPGGETITVETCCERDAITQLRDARDKSKRSNLMMLEQPDDLPRACAEHSYDITNAT